MRKLFLFGIVLVMSAASHAEIRNVKIFVALCDNESQGIVPVPAGIGNGNDPDGNLYWGCAEGVRSWFKRSKQWTVAESALPPTEPVLDRLTATHKEQDLSLTADAYRGNAIAQCVMDFERAVSSGDYDFVAFVGHNGLMDFTLPEPPALPSNGTGVAVLCCKSRSYFQSRVQKLGGTPLLLTEQFMYPGAFLVHDAIEAWATGGDATDVRTAAGKAYAKNQKLSLKAATGVFSDLVSVTPAP